MPDTTRSNAPPNTPSRANMTHSAGGPGDRPRLGHALDVDPPHLGPDEVERAERGAGARVLAVGGGDHHVAELDEPAGQHVEADGVDAVVVGHRGCAPSPS